MVWSDQEVQAASREFVPVADEVYMLYPEDAGNLARVANDPAHQLFKRFGESMPPGDWHHPGTKQGVYMMGPDGEYLEGAHAISGNAGEVKARLQRALQRWETLKKAKKYANKPVPPPSGAPMPPEFQRAPMALRVSMRDLRPGQQATTPRWRQGAFDDGAWPEFMKWAWNQNWLAIDDPRSLVPAGDQPERVADAQFRRWCRMVLIDNVRGQAPEWQDAEVKTATLTMRRLAGGKTTTVEYVGEASMQAGPRRLAVRLHGEAEWDAGKRAFVRFDLVALGTRAGAAPFNQREQMPGPSPIGFALRLAVPTAPAPTKKK